MHLQLAHSDVQAHLLGKGSARRLSSLYCLLRLHRGQLLMLLCLSQLRGVRNEILGFARHYYLDPGTLNHNRTLRCRS
jgi:hypothetical protein